MKKVLVFVSLCLIFSACKNTWDNEDKDMLFNSCMEDARTWAGSEDNAKAICQCRLDKIMQKYPHENDALDHIDSIMKDPDIAACKDEVLNKK